MSNLTISQNQISTLNDSINALKQSLQSMADRISNALKPVVAQLGQLNGKLKEVSKTLQSCNKPPTPSLRGA